RAAQLVDLPRRDDADLLADNKEHWLAQEAGRRRRHGELAEDRDRGAPAVAPAVAAFHRLQVLRALLLDELGRVQPGRAGERDRDRILRRREDALLPYRVRGAEGVPGRDPDRRVEQGDTLDALGEARRELDQDATAEAVADPGRVVHAGRGGRLEHVVDVRLEAPRRFPAGAAVPAQVGSEHTESR